MVGKKVREHKVVEEKRTFDKQYEDMVTGLEQRCSKPEKNNSHMISITDPWFHNDYWFPQLRDWADITSRNLPNQIAARRRGFFDLHTHDFYPHEFGHDFPILDLVNRRMSRLQQELNNTLASFDKGIIIPMQNNFDIVPKSAAAELGILADAYQVGEDGHLNFTVGYNVQDFKPEDLKVTTVDNNRLVVEGEKVEKLPNGDEQMRKFYRSTVLPDSVDVEKLQSKLTSDGVLVLEVPLKQPKYHQLKFDDEKKLCISPESEKDHNKKDRQLALIGKSGPIVIEDEKQNKLLHFEMPIDPRFSEKDVSIRMDANRINVSGKKDAKHNEKLENGEFKSMESSAFSRVFSIPQTIDPCSVNAVIKDGNLIIEAPLAKL